MVQAFSQRPLNEPILAFPPVPYDAVQDLQRLLSPDSAVRATAAEALKRSGDEKTAQHIENLLLGGSISPEVRSDARNVLLDLSSKYRQYLLDVTARVRRTRAVSIPAITRTKTPPRGVPAIRP